MDKITNSDEAKRVMSAGLGEVARGGSIRIDSISAKRTQFEGAGAEAIDKIFARRLGIVGGLDWGRVLTARETSAPSQPAPPKIAPPMAWDEAADAYF